MKKIILAVLLLIPIIVILVINISEIIISSTVMLDVENIQLTYEGIPFVSKELNFEDYKTKTFNIGVDFFPKVAVNRDIEWISSDTEIAEVREGKVTIKNYGSVDIIAMSTNNNNAKAIGTLYITGKTLQDIRILSFGRFDEGDIGIKKYESLQLEGVVVPMSAMEDKIEWTSDSTDILTVDANGVLIAKDFGEANITATATNQYGSVKRSIKVIVAGSAIIKSYAVFIDSGSYDITQNINTSNYTVTVEGGILTGNTVITSDTATLTVKTSSETAVFTVTNLLTEKILIKNYDELLLGMWAKGNFVATNSSNIVLTAITALGTNKSIEWESSNSDVIKVIDGRLYAGDMTGEVEITAMANNSIPASFVVRVLTPVTYFRLDQNVIYDDVGLAQNKKIGALTIEDGKIKEGVKLGIASVYPSDAEQIFEYKSSDTSLAKVDNYGLVIFTSNARNKGVTITVSPVFSTISAIASYTFNIVEGVNIGMGKTNIYDEEKNQMPSFAPYEDMHYVLKKTDYAVILHTDVYLPSAKDGGTPFINFTNSIYGNGHKIDSQLYSDSPKSRMLYWNLDDREDALSASANITIENVSIQAYKPTSEDSKDAFTTLIEKGGGPVAVEGARQKGQEFAINFRYCLFQYAYSHLDFTAGDILVEGCILRNNSATAVTIQYCETDAANVTVKNCIFSNTISPVGVILGELDKVVALKKNYTLKYSTFAFEGENYIYNWKNIEEIRMDMLPSVPDNPSFNALVYQFNNMLSDFLRTIFTLKANSDILYFYQNSNHVNLGFIILGLWYDANPQLNPVSSSGIGVNIHIDISKYWLKKIDISEMPVVQNPILRAVGIKVDNYAYMINQKYDDGTYNTQPDETYMINAKTYSRLHGNK